VKKTDLPYLKRAAMAYLARYASSSQNLHRVLMRRVMKRCREAGTDPNDFTALVDEAVAACQAAQLVSDEAFARGRIETLKTRGWPERRIRAALAQKGVPQAISLEALGEAGLDDSDAARRFAERRRLGPWRQPDARAAKRDRDIAALARAGFAYRIAIQVIDHEIALDPDQGSGTMNARG
jgi:regulatory protein